VTLRCASKALALLNVRAHSLANPPASDDDWYLLWARSAECLLFTHAGTLFRVFVADVRAADLRNVVDRSVAAAFLSSASASCRARR
jgi:hypothetical protein